MSVEIAKGLGLAIACSLLVACGSTEYLITKRDGSIIQAYGKPKVDAETGMVTYRDEDGRTMQMQREDVSQILER
jgi:hypothetical protein